MARYDILFSLFTSILIVTTSLLCGAIDEERKVYIVYLGSIPEGNYSPSSHQLSLLQEVVKESSLDNLLTRSYRRSFNGFAAKLTDYEARKLARLEGVVSVFPSRIVHLHTTRSWDFMGFHENTSRNASAASDIIVGVIDSGIWPESESFSDEGFGPAPKKWKGACNGGKNFTCNNKIIGARYYFQAGIDARDDVGHGTHTASTIAGNKVKDASFYGLAQGIARGGAPSARIAVYKACSPNDCDEADILNAFDDAISDGVDIISLSLGPDGAVQFLSDALAVGSFHAMEKGILTINSAGNSGPNAGSVASVAPWLLSVAASTTDRRIIDKVILGNGKTLVGNSVNSFTSNGTKFPLIYGTDAAPLCSEVGARMCQAGCLNSTLVKGKIVVCDQSKGIAEAYSAGAAGSIVLSSSQDNIPFVSQFPSSTLTIDEYDSLKSYISSTRKPEAEIFKSEVIKDPTAPVVASFSSRGPNTITPDIMKPDVSAPGVDILAAFVPILPPQPDFRDKRRVKYNILSGTSMSCPHVAAVAAYVKAVHPDWSPSAIKSAIMTTAWPMNATKNLDGEFAYGSGHVNPVKATVPGLVYESLKSDYVNLLCSTGYDTVTVRKITKDNSTCPKDSDKVLPKDFNYPSMTVRVSPRTPFKIKFRRTVTVVGHSNSTYKAKVYSRSKVNVEVVPDVLSFKSSHEKKAFSVTVAGGGLPDRTMVSASLVWYDGLHVVRSPIVVHTK